MTTQADSAAVQAFEDEIEALRVEHGFPTAQYAFARDGEVIATGSLGEATAESRFCIMSASKPIFGMLVLKLIGDGVLSLDTMVVDVWPEFGEHGKDGITVEHLLTFTAGIPAWWLDAPDLHDREQRAASLAALQPLWEPGTQTFYHPLSAHWVLAEVLMRVTGRDHRELMRTEVLDPLDLPRLALGVPVEASDGPVPYVKIGEPRPDLVEALTGQPATAEGIDSGDDAALMGANDPATIADGVPGGGMISDARSVALFYQHLLHDPTNLWDPELRRRAISEPTNSLPDPLRAGAAANRSIGSLLITRDESTRFTVPALGIDESTRHHGTRVSDGTFGHGGAGGQIAFADPARGISFCYLSNGFLRDVVADRRRVQTIIDAAITAADSI